MTKRTRTLARAVVRAGDKSSAVGFTESKSYWELRYASGGSSGRGSYGAFAKFKARFLNSFVAEHGIRSVIEFGCGDGNQLSLAEYPRYLGLDVSENAIVRCRSRFSHDPTKAFASMGEHAGQRADLAISLDVIYHLVEDAVFFGYMATLFAAADRFVIIYSSDVEIARSSAPHVRHRCFSAWVASHASAWQLSEHVHAPLRLRIIRRPSAGFFVYERRA